MVKRLILAWGTYVILTYVMVLLGPKDAVQYRWLGGQLRARVSAPRWAQPSSCCSGSAIRLSAPITG